MSLGFSDQVQHYAHLQRLATHCLEILKYMYIHVYSIETKGDVLSILSRQ